ncbi:MAG TPA: hypothetical protein VH394_11790 [Thermoanaerobaculia bacterium]|nr:hypothetical protein [Thermoanaerobaculia bacterium]
MKTKAFAMAMTGVILFAASGNAEPLDEVRARLSALRNDQPMRLLVDVKLEHRGSAPLHLNKTKRRGRATVELGPRGVKMLEQQWFSSSSHFSLWRSKRGDSDIPLLSFEEALDLADPAGALDFALSDAVVLEDRTVTWHEQPARLLVVRPAQLVAHEETSPLVTEVKIWLDPSGIPLAMERSSEFQLGHALKATQLLTFTYQQVEGRLLADEVREDFQSTAIAVLRGRDKRIMKVRIEG